MDAGRGQDRLTIVEQPPRPPTTFYPTSMDSLNQQQQQHQQLRAGTGYGDLCRTQGPTDALSAAYHSRYLASLPALSSTSGSNFPFLGSMFASGPTSPFRAPSAPGVSNCGTNGTTNPMRQQLFWPPTPPPDGYGRYGLNTSLFPLFGSVSPSPNDGGATAAAYMLSQGLVSRHLTPCTTTTSSHPMLDTHKDRGFFSPGFGLGSPLAPSSQMTATNPFSHHLIPPPHPLDYNKFSSFCPPPGLNSTGTKDFLAAVTDDSKSQPHHHHHHHHHHPTNCQLTVKSENSNSPSTTSISSNVTAIKHSHPQQTPSSKSSRSERKSVSSYSPKRSKDTRHNEDVKPQAKSQDEPINKHYQQSRHLQHYFPPSGMKSCSPFEIDVTCGPTIKPDILSPPIDSSSDAALPGSPYQDKKKDLLSEENRCLSCANDVLEKKDIPKVEEDEDENSVVVIVDIDEKTSRSSPKNESADDTVPNDSSMTVMTKSDDVKSVDCSDIPKNEVVPPPMPNSVFPTFDKSDSSNLVASSRADTVVNNVSSKHVTAAVIPTAPKQQHFSNYHHSRVDTVNSTLSRQSSASELETKGTCRPLGDSPKITLSALSKIKSELTESVESTLPVMYHQNSSSNFCRHLNSNVNKTSCTKVKDMIKSMDSSAKQTSSPSQVAVVDGHQTTPNSVDKTFRTTSPSVTKLCPVMPEKTVQGKVQAMTVDSKKRIVGPLKAESPVYRFDSFNNDLSPKPPLANWSKATVSPYNWQQKDEDQQAINLTVCKKNLESVSPLLSSTENVTTEITDPGDARTIVSTSPKTPFTVENIMSTSNTTTTSCCVAGTGVIGVCHPNVTKGKMFAVGGSVSKFSAMTSVTSQMDVGNDGEVHLSSHSVHATKSSTFQTLNPAAAACLNRAASVTGFQNTKTQLKTERLTPHVRTKGKDSEKVMPTTGRAATLATLAPKLTKKLGFLKDGKSSHTLSTSSSVSSTSIVFPATGNSCIPVGIAIAQQRQDSSTTATVGKNHTSVPSANTGISPSTAAQLTSGRVPTEIQQSQEFLRDQKPQDISCPNSNSTVSSDSANFLVTQGPTIVSRQWESEAVTRATLPSPWLAQGPIVAPALWIGQGTTAAAAYAATSAGPAATPQLPAPIPTSVNPLEPSPISLPPGGYQLARDSVTGHLFLIPAANIVDRTAVWPSYNTSAGSTLPIQQLVTQQHHTQFEQVLPQVPEQEHLQDCLALSVQQTQIGESGKDIRTIDNCCDTPGNYKTTDLHGIKTEEKDSNHVPPVPLASGQTFTFTTFPAPCDPSGFSYVLQSSTVMHLAHTAQTTSIQTESGKRSQGTSPLHPATPSPSPSLPMSSTLLMSENEEEEETRDSDSDGMASGDSMQLKISQQTQSVTTAVQVDMDSRTNSEEEEEEEVYEDDDKKSSSVNIEQVKMSDSANQTETVLSDSGKGDSESELLVEETTTDETKKAAVIQELTPSTKESLSLSSETVDIKKISSESPVSEIFVTEDCEIAPSLPVESKPVMDFIDHHGLDLLVDSIEEFASRERQETEEEEQPQHTPQLDQPRLEEIKDVTSSEKKFIAPVPSYGALDTSCTDGLGLLCALAEQRFFEEARISDGTVDKPSTEKLATDKPATEKLVTKKPAYDCYSFLEDEGPHNVNMKYSSPKKEASFHKNTSPSPSFQQIMDAPVEDLPSSNLRACEKEMRKRLADLQRKYKEKQLQLARLMPNGDSDEEDSIVDDGKPSEVPHHFHKKKTFSLPRFKHKSMTSGKSNTRFQSHSYKAMTQRLTNNRSNLSNNFQKRKLQKIGRTTGLSKLTKFSTNHSKEASHSLPVSTESETKVKKPAKIQVDSSHTRDKSNLFNKSKIMKKNVQKDTPSKSSSTCHQAKPPSLKASHSKSKTTFSQKCSVVAKHGSQRDSMTPITKSKPGESLKSSKLSSNTNSSHESSKHRVEVSHNRSSSESQLKRKAVKYETKQVKRIKMENSQPSRSTVSDTKTKNHGESSQIKKSKTESHQISNRTDSKGKEKSKVPFFDEQAWFVRRSERIFLSDARSPLAQQSSSSNTSNSNNNAVKKVNPASNVSQKVDSTVKDKKENSVKSPAKISDSKPNVSVKSEKDKEQLWKSMKNKLSSKPKSKLPGQVSPSKKHSTSSSSSKSSESSSSVESDSSDDSSCHSDNNVSSRASEDSPTPVTASVEKPKKTESETKAKADREKEAVRVNNSTSCAQACLLEPKLEDHARVLVLDEGLFYAGHVIDIEAPDVYGIILDGKRIHRPYIFSREEILNAAVLEIKPTETTPLPEGCRVCAYWSQQYRCLYPGTVAKACSPLSDPSLLYVEFDDGDSGRIPLDDIRMLPPDFPIVSMDLNPLSLLGKRRPRVDKDSAGEQKSQNPPPQQKVEKSPVKDSPRIKRKRTSSADGKVSREHSKNGNQSPSNKKASSAPVEGQTSTVSKQAEPPVPTSTSSDKIKSKKIKVKEEGNNKKKKVKSRDSSTDAQLKIKKRKKHREEHKHHHKHKHHHHKHHHKKHKQNHSAESVDDCSEDTSKVTSLYSPSHDGEMVILTAEKTSDLTVTIKTSPSPHTTNAAAHGKHLPDPATSEKSVEREGASSSKSSDGKKNDSNVKPKVKSNKKKVACEMRPAKRKERVPSVEKSKMAAFLPVRQLWRWSGKGFRRPGGKGKGKKEFFRAIQRGKELLRVGDCAVFLSTGRPHLPYIGRIETMWESWGGKMDVRVKWFYHPEETKSSRKLTHLKAALFQSPHFDENDVQTISHKCEVLSWDDYQERKDKEKADSPFFDNNDTYYLAGTYDPITGNFSLEPGVPKAPTTAEN